MDREMPMASRVSTYKMLRLLPSVDDRYRSILRVILSQKSWEFKSYAYIFIQNDANSVCPLENIATSEFVLKCR